MFKSCICGSFHQHQELEDQWGLPSPRRNSSCRRTYKDCKNPYSNRGRDKFCTLLEDLQEKRQKIYDQMGSDEIFVRFVYSNSKGWVPVVAKFKDQQKQGNKPKLVDENNNNNNNNNKDKAEKPSSEAVEKSSMESSTASPKEVKLIPPLVASEKNKKQSFSWSSTKMGSWRRTSFYLPIVFILILLCLVMFGRSMAILCTSVGWYLVPTVTGRDSNLRRLSMKKKEYSRKFSEKKIVVSDGSSSPKSK